MFKLHFLKIKRKRLATLVDRRPSFNLLGTVASVDTTNRIATQAVQLRMSQGILPAVTSHTLTVVSIDNLDPLQPHAFVSTTFSTRSWHGTSIQLSYHHQNLSASKKKKSALDKTTQFGYLCPYYIGDK